MSDQIPFDEDGNPVQITERDLPSEGETCLHRNAYSEVVDYDDSEAIQIICPDCHTVLSTRSLPRSPR